MNINKETRKMFILKFCKRNLAGLMAFFMPLFVFAQTQYDYYDDDAVAGGVDRAVTFLVIIVGLVVAFIVFVFIAKGLFKVYYWFNPDADPELKNRKIKEEKEIEEKKKHEVFVQKQRQKVKSQPIDLGLSVCWADSNLISDSNTDNSKYSWGNSNKQTSFRYVDCSLSGKWGVELKKLIGNDDQCISGNIEYDAARLLLGEGWRIPQKYEIKELIEKCVWQWTSNNGINGYTITGCNGNTIFLPVTGEKVFNDNKSTHAGCYWSGSGCEFGNDAYYLYFDEGNIVMKDNGQRFHGMAIRPVWSSLEYTMEKNGFMLSSYGTKLIKCNDVEICHIPFGVKVVCRDAFKNALKIIDLFISDSVEEIEEHAFEGLNIESVHIPKSIIKWGEGAFSMCEKLKTVYLEEGVSQLGIDMFMNCSSLESIVIPESIKSLPKAIFYMCESLKHIKLPSKLVSIGEMAFGLCEKLEYIELPGSLIGIRDETFVGCLNLERVTISEGITVISRRCFMSCWNLQKIRIPSTLQHIDTDAFKNCCDLIIEVPKGTATLYQEMNLDGVTKIIEYESSSPNNIDELKAKSEEFIKIQNYIRKQNNYERRKEMGLLTKEEIEKKEFLYDDTDDYYDTDDLNDDNDW